MPRVLILLFALFYTTPANAAWLTLCNKTGHGLSVAIYGINWTLMFGEAHMLNAWYGIEDGECEKFPGRGYWESFYFTDFERQPVQFSPSDEGSRNARRGPKILCLGPDIIDEGSRIGGPISSHRPPCVGNQTAVPHSFAVKLGIYNEDQDMKLTLR